MRKREKEMDGKNSLLDEAITNIHATWASKIHCNTNNKLLSLNGLINAIPNERRAMITRFNVAIYQIQDYPEAKGISPEKKALLWFCKQTTSLPCLRKAIKHAILSRMQICMPNIVSVVSTNWGINSGLKIQFLMNTNTLELFIVSDIWAVQIGICCC